MTHATTIIAGEQPASPADGLEAVIPSVGKIVGAVANYFSVPLGDITGHRRQKHLVEIRWIAIYLIRQIRRESLATIGRELGFHHTSIMYAMQTLDSKRKSDPQLQQRIDILSAALGAKPATKCEIETEAKHGMVTR